MIVADLNLLLYAVFDGMGGHMAGDVASSKARDVVHEYIRANYKSQPPEELIRAAVNARLERSRIPPSVAMGRPRCPSAKRRQISGRARSGRRSSM